MNKAELYLILGGGIAGVKAAEAVRNMDPAAEILLASEESDWPYNRPRMTKSRLRGTDPAEEVIEPPTWFEERKIKFCPDKKAVRIETEKHRVTFADGGSIIYKKCVYALGGVSFIPPVPGANADTVITIRTPADLLRLRRSMVGAGSAAVIGGGTVGVEITLALLSAGIHVTLIEEAPRLLNRILDAGTAQKLERQLCGNGAEVLTGFRVSAVLTGGRYRRVLLDNGKEITADFAVLSAGVRPNIALAREAGLETRRGLLVNEKMQTSCPDIFSGGDCIEFRGRSVSSWVDSLEQGTVAGENAAGGDRTVRPAMPSTLIWSENIHLFAGGDLGKIPGGSYLHRNAVFPVSPQRFRVNAGGPEQTTSVSCWYQDGRLVGAAMLGDLSEMEQLRKAVQEGRPWGEDWREELQR